MMPFSKPRNTGDTGAALGRLELSVMEIVWRRGESSVRDVIVQLARPLAYTTVMTTLDRLYKKNLLERRKAERAFRYSARCSRSEWERKRADSLLTGLLTGFLSRPALARDLLISCLVDAAGQYDDALLKELESKIRAKRKELLHRSSR